MGFRLARLRGRLTARGRLLATKYAGRFAHAFASGRTPALTCRWIPLRDRPSSSPYSPDLARTWLRIRVELIGGRGIVCKPSPGRDVIVRPGHSFAQLAEAIDNAFARWDRSHLHGF